jgi:hypothetical protein
MNISLSSNFIVMCDLQRISMNISLSSMIYIESPFPGTFHCHVCDKKFNTRRERNDE